MDEQEVGSGRHGCKSGKVKVLLPSVACFRRLACPKHALVTMRDLLGCKSHGCPASFLGAAAGETWVANKPGGLNVRNSDDLEIHPA